MKSSHSRRARTALLLALAALAALPALVGSASAAAPGAHAAKARCRARGRARARSCRRAARRHSRRHSGGGGGSVPRPFTPLTGPDFLTVLVMPQRSRSGPPTTIVQVRRGNVAATCTPAGGTPRTRTFGFVASADLHGSSFSGRTTFPQRNWVRVEGRFLSDRKVVGTLQMGGIVDLDGAVCDSGPVPFTATG